MRKLGNTDVFNKTVALRVDLNVPVKDGKVLDDTRIVAITPTLQYLKKQKSKVVLISHFGRPEPGIFDQKFSLLPVAKRLEEIFNTRVQLFQSFKDINFDDHISLIENIRFLPGEVHNDPDLSRQLSDLADVYIFDAFGTSHRSHASTFGAINSSDTSCAGLLLEEETNALIKAMDSKETPTLSIVGGSKVSSKLEVIKSLLHVSNEVLTEAALQILF
jgi:phosphoglycerate kinase